MKYLEIDPSLKPGYHFWMSHGLWTLEEATFLLLDIDPRISDEDFRIEKNPKPADAFHRLRKLDP